jgi:hypothetical protein
MPDNEAVFEKMFPGKLRIVREFYQRVEEAAPSLKPGSPKLIERVRKAVFWTPLDEVLLVKPSDLAAKEDPEQGALGMALVTSFEDSLNTYLQDDPESLALMRAQSIEVSNVIDRCIEEWFDRALAKYHRRLDAVAEAAFSDVIDESVLGGMLSAHDRSVTTVLGLMTIFELSNLSDKVAQLQPFLSLCLAERIPIGVDFTTNTAVILVGE